MRSNGWTLANVRRRNFGTECNGISLSCGYTANWGVELPTTMRSITSSDNWGVAARTWLNTFASFEYKRPRSMSVRNDDHSRLAIRSTWTNLLRMSRWTSAEEEVHAVSKRYLPTAFPILFPSQSRSSSRVEVWFTNNRCKWLSWWGLNWPSQRMGRERKNRDVKFGRDVNARRFEIDCIFPSGPLWPDPFVIEVRMFHFWSYQAPYARKNHPTGKFFGKVAHP